MHFKFSFPFRIIDVRGSHTACGGIRRSAWEYELRALKRNGCRKAIARYYAVSPTFVKWFGKTKWFKKLWRGKLDKMVKNLQERGVESTQYCDKEW